jgi:hypothetical protein
MIAAAGSPASRAVSIAATSDSPMCRTTSRPGVSASASERAEHLAQDLYMLLGLLKILLPLLLQFVVHDLLATVIVVETVSKETGADLLTAARKAPRAAAQRGTLQRDAAEKRPRNHRR